MPREPSNAAVLAVVLLEGLVQAAQARRRPVSGDVVLEHHLPHERTARVLSAAIAGLDVSERCIERAHVRVAVADRAALLGRHGVSHEPARERQQVLGARPPLALGVGGEEALGFPLHRVAVFSPVHHVAEDLVLAEGLEDRQSAVLRSGLPFVLVDEAAQRRDLLVRRPPPREDELVRSEAPVFLALELDAIGVVVLDRFHRGEGGNALWVESAVPLHHAPLALFEPRAHQGDERQVAR